VPKEEENPEIYIFLKLAKKLGVKTLKREGDYKIYFVKDFLKEKMKKLLFFFVLYSIFNNL